MRKPFKSIGPFHEGTCGLRDELVLAGMNICSTVLLFYTAVIVPVQILIWNYDDPCVMFPTLYFDILVDFFFMVTLPFTLSPPLPCCAVLCDVKARNISTSRELAFSQIKLICPLRTQPRTEAHVHYNINVALSYLSY